MEFGKTTKYLPLETFRLYSILLIIIKLLHISQFYSITFCFSAYLEKAISDFTEASIDLYNNIQLAKNMTDVKGDENTVRIINNQLMNIERAFLHDEGLPGRSYFKYAMQLCHNLRFSDCHNNIT